MDFSRSGGSMKKGALSTAIPRPLTATISTDARRFAQREETEVVMADRATESPAISRWGVTAE